MGERELYLLDVPSLEDALNACWTAAVGGFAAIVLDTVEALPTRNELTIGINEPYTLKATPRSKVLSRCLPRLSGLIHNTGCTLILVNQMRDKPDVRYGRPDRPTGGKAIGYFAALRLETHRIEQIKPARGEAVGQVVTVEVQKCKYAAPGMRLVVKLIYGEGLLNEGF